MSEWDEALSEFWAGKLEDIRLYVPLHRVVMTVRVVTKANDAPDKTDRRIASWHEVAFEGVTRLAFADADTDTWTSTELTEIYKRKLDGATEYSFEMAGGIEDALMITCEDVRVTFLRNEEVHVSEVR
ncbi:MAG: hypothetical protein GEV03_13565 [Streptosporangiales bacterium]|nr:hypothetical protein [Streptosporangiales bacterium]